HQVDLDPFGELVVPGVGERVGRFAEEEVGMPAHLVEVVEPPTGPFDPLRRLAELADGRDRRVVGAVGPPIDREPGPTHVHSVIHGAPHTPPRRLRNDRRPVPLAWRAMGTGAAPGTSRSYVVRTYGCQM